MANTDTQSCDATLTIFSVPYYGATGTAKGHAEMAALDNFIEGVVAATATQQISSALDKLKRARSKTVYCPSKPCCIKCSAVLQKLGFTCAVDSSFSDQKMEPTEWGVTMRVRALIEAAGMDYESVKRLA
jgi:hypothetical protein